jgi:hypothetical protein
MGEPIMSALPSSPSRRAGAAAPRRSGPAGSPRLRVVPPPRHTARYTVLLLFVAVAGVFGVVRLNARAAEAALEARELEGDVRELTLRYEELTAEVAALEAPDRVRNVAGGELGMVPAEQPGFLVAARPLATDGNAEAAVDVGGRPVTDPLKPVLGSGP